MRVDEVQPERRSPRSVVLPVGFTVLFTGGLMVAGLVALPEDAAGQAGRARRVGEDERGVSVDTLAVAPVDV